jgi:hypothetical protein
MIRRSTFILLIIFVILLASVAFWQRTKSSEEVIETPTEIQEYLFDFNNEINALTITGKDGEIIELVRKSDGQWELLQPVGEETDSDNAEAAISRISVLRVLAKLEQSSTDLAVVGLDKPSYEISITLDDGSVIVTKVGDLTPTDSGYYVSGSGRGILVVDKYGLQSIIDLLDNPPIMPTPTIEASTSSP